MVTWESSFLNPNLYSAACNNAAQRSREYVGRFSEPSKHRPTSSTHLRCQYPVSRVDNLAIFGSGERSEKVASCAMSMMRKRDARCIDLSGGSNHLRGAQRQLLRIKSVNEMRKTNLNRRLHASSRRAQCLSSLSVRDPKPFIAMYQEPHQSNDRRHAAPSPDVLFAGVCKYVRIMP